MVELIWVARGIFLKLYFKLNMTSGCVVCWRVYDIQYYHAVGVPMGVISGYSFKALRCFNVTSDEIYGIVLFISCCHDFAIAV
jgi:hypothetical protein